MLRELDAPIAAAHKAAAGMVDAYATAVRSLVEHAVSDAAAARAEAKLLRDENASLREKLRRSERHKGLFRQALFVYLQERDGPAGVNAPTPETLRRIRELLENRDNDT